MRTRLTVALACCLLLASVVLAGDGALTLVTASGTVDKVEKDTLTIRPRGAGGKFEKSLVLKLTGTSELSAVSYRKQGGKLVLVQRKVEPKDLQPNEAVAVIYTRTKTGSVLLSGVVHPSGAK